MSPRDYDDLPLDRETTDESPGGRHFGSQPEERSGGAGRWIAVLAILALLGAGAWYLARRRQPPAAPPAVAAEPAAAAPAPVADAAPAERSFVIPSLEASDPLIRELVASLSAQPRLARWLANENLVRRFVAAVDNLAEGTSPTTHLRPLGPDGAFRVARPRADAAPVVDAASYQRYDALVDAFVALPTAELARLYRELRPLFNQAYAELGYPGRSFDDRLAEAMGRLLAVEVPNQPEVKLKVVTYEYMDPELEARSAADKHLMRLGPENARRVQAKLREIATAIGVAPR
jgi:hypothetical protein